MSDLSARLGAHEYGYSLSDDLSNARCFQGILASNIATLITNQYDSSDVNILNWSQPANISSINIANIRGDYYLAHAPSNLVSITTSPPPGSKVILVDGENLAINTNIIANTTDTIVIIARKNGSTGGNIYIDPSVTEIDAILITDGAIMNAQNGVVKNWIDNAALLNQRLTINGRLYSFNTRGGSLNPDLTKVTGTGSYYDGTLFKSDATPSDAASMDLENFRLVGNDGDATCSLAINYRILTLSTLPAILQRPKNYSFGPCSF